jgi:hypothetical protein
MKNAAPGATRAARSEILGDTFTSTTNILSPTVPPAQDPASGLTIAYRQCCEARALSFANGLQHLHTAVDGLQALAKQTGLIDRIGLDQVYAMMSAAFGAVRRGAI